MPCARNILLGLIVVLMGLSAGSFAPMTGLHRTGYSGESQQHDTFSRLRRTREEVRLIPADGLTKREIGFMGQTIPQDSYEVSFIK